MTYANYMWWHNRKRLTSMARKNVAIRICKLPKETLYQPENGENQQKILLQLEEYEVIRLLDYQGLTQEQCAKHLNVSRATVQSIYMQARQKLARFLVEGMTLQITGGAYELCSQSCCKNRCNAISDDKKTSKLKYEFNKGDRSMIIAVTYENGQVFQHFGHTEQFKVYTVENGKILESKVVDTNGQGHGALADFLANEGVEVLICGGIGGGAKNALAAAGIQLYPGASGNADAQVASFLEGSLNYNPDTMCNHHGEGHEHSCGGHGEGHEHSCGGHGEGHEHSCGGHHE